MKIWAILLTILLIGVCLRIYNLDGECIWSDEGFSIKLAAKDVHPPLYYILLHYWIDLFGDSEFSTRMLSVIFGVIAIFVMYMLGSLIFEKKVGILGSLILSISVFHIRYSQEVRMYTLLTLLAILSVYFYVKLLENRRDLPTILGYIAATCLMMYTHCYGIFILVGQNVYYILLLFLKKANKPNTKCWIVLQTLVLILFTPWIFILINQISRVETMGFWIHEPSIINLIASFHIYSSKSPLLLLIYLLLILFPIWEISCRMRGSFYWKEHLLGARGILLLLVLIVTSNVLPFIVSKISTPVYLFRTTISASVAFYLLVAKGIKDLGHKLLEILTVTVIVLLSPIRALC
jgi:mannosyltransferase